MKDTAQILIDTVKTKGEGLKLCSKQFSPVDSFHFGGVLHDDKGPAVSVVRPRPAEPLSAVRLLQKLAQMPLPTLLHDFHNLRVLKYKHTFQFDHKNLILPLQIINCLHTIRYSFSFFLVSSFLFDILEKGSLIKLTAVVSPVQLKFSIFRRESWLWRKVTRSSDCELKL